LTPWSINVGSRGREVYRGVPQSVKEGASIIPTKSQRGIYRGVPQPVKEGASNVPTKSQR